MAPDRTGKSVFLGNIPYNLTEEQVKDILSSAGTVTKFRLMMNPETGKPKGYGFADFADADAAASAVRNLNDYEIMGRKIRVDWPHNNEKDSVPLDYSQQGAPDAQAAHQMQAPLLPSLPPGADLPPNLTCPNAISQTLSTLPAPQLLDILTQMKALAVTDPAKATELLNRGPQLAYAIFQALLLMNLVDYNTLSTVVEQATIPQPVPSQTPQPSHLPQQLQQYPPVPIQQVSTPPVHNAPFAPPPPQPQPQAAQPSLPAQIPRQEDLLQQVLNMPQSAIDSLPPTERGQILLLRQQILQGGMR